MSFWGIRVLPRPAAFIRKSLQSLSKATRVDVVGFMLKGANWQIWIESKGASSQRAKYVGLAITWPLCVWHCPVLGCQNTHAILISISHRDLWLAEVA